MLAYVLALVIGLASFAIYMAAFFFPEVHRKEDFIWSGVGLFYALVLWVCAGRITGGVLLGQLASIALLGWFGWQTFTLRRELTAPEQRTAIAPEVAEKLKGFSLPNLGQQLQKQASGLLKKPQAATKPAQSAKVATTTESTPAAETATDSTVTSPLVTIIDSTTTPTDATTEAKDAITSLETSAPPTVPDTLQEEPAADDAQMSESPELIRPNPPDPALVEAAQQSAPADTLESSEETVTPDTQIPPDAELAPPAEPPGDGDPQMRQNPPEADIPLAGVPIDPENPPKLG
jgi:hypothetical protein